MTTRRIAALGVAAALAVGASACGTENVDLHQEDKGNVGIENGSQLFAERCSGCHTLDSVGAGGSKPEKNPESGERTNGPNFNVRSETRDDVLYAIRNGGFSGAIMPANIVVGQDADDVADFLSKYAGGGTGTDPTKNTEPAQE